MFGVCSAAAPFGTYFAESILEQLLPTNWSTLSSNFLSFTVAEDSFIGLKGNDMCTPSFFWSTSPLTPRLGDVGSGTCYMQNLLSTLMAFADPNILLCGENRQGNVKPVKNDEVCVVIRFSTLRAALALV